VSAISLPTTGTVHHTLLVQTAAGSYAVRVYRYRDRQRVEDEHALIRYAQERGLPAVAPLPLLEGTTTLERAGCLVAVFPRASGQQLDRTELKSRHIAAMGRCLARLHRALVDFPSAQVSVRSLAVETARTLSGIAALEAIIHAHAPGHADDGTTLVQLAQRRAWLLANGERARCDLTGLAAQVIHGDYQHTNVFFEHDAVSAIIDWDQAYVAPRAWEVVRTLHLVFAFAPRPCHRFLEAYAAGAPLSLADLDRAAAAYSSMRAHDLWLYEAVYRDGNERVRRFLPGGPFVPLWEPWRALRAALA
jgi:homoserine kinase type II